MHNYPFEGLISSKQYEEQYIKPAVGSPLPRTKSRVKSEENEYMFLEDLRLRALPYDRGASKGFSLDINSSDEKTLDLVRDAIPALHYRHGRLEESFRDYIQGALPVLATGTLYLEIEYFWDPENEEGRPIAFRLDMLRPEFVTKRYRKYHYLTPDQSEVDDEDNDDEHWSKRPIDQKVLIVVSLPRQLRRELDRTLRVIKATGPELNVLLDFANGVYGENSGFNFSAYQRMSHDIVLRASKSVGWTRRGAYTEDLLDPEKAWRAMQFTRTIVKLRDIATQGLQQAIDQAGSKIGFTAELKLSHVLTEEHLDRLESELEAGTRPIGDMFSPKAHP